MNKFLTILFGAVLAIVITGCGDCQVRFNEEEAADARPVEPVVAPVDNSVEDVE